MLLNGLLFRKEVKYVLSRWEYISFVNIVKQFAKYDHNSLTDGRYLVRSLYFDDMHNSAYHDKKLGLPRTYKFRIRNYNSSAGLKLEKKLKIGDWIGKESEEINNKKYLDIINGIPAVLSQSSSNLTKSFHIDVSTRGLKPKIVIEYQREAYVWQIGEQLLRFTFDSGLQWLMNSIDMFDQKAVYKRAFDEERFIFEVKYFDFLPGVLSTALKSLDRFPMGSSKYQLCRKQKEEIYRR